jgi:hypothetical protein
MGRYVIERVREVRFLLSDDQTDFPFTTSDFLYLYRRADQMLFVRTPECSTLPVGETACRRFGLVVDHEYGKAKAPDSVQHFNRGFVVERVGPASRTKRIDDNQCWSIVLAPAPYRVDRSRKVLVKGLVEESRWGRIKFHSSRQLVKSS